MMPPVPTSVHFIGIGGYGMSALARILLKKGYSVSGSDLKSSFLSEGLSWEGARVEIGHRSENLGKAELIIYSTAIDPENVELKAASKADLKLWHRSELLAAMLNDAYGIAVAGAHGKTTTTAMVALLLEAGGLDPTAVIGGVLPAYKSNARLGSGPYLVAEADESDRSFTRYYPRIALVTGVEPDHLEHYNNDYGLLKQAYAEFLSHLPASGTAVLCADDAVLVAMAGRLACKKILYGAAVPPIKGDSYGAANIELNERRSSFDLYRGDRLLAAGVALSVPGRHNVSNAVGALAVAHRVGLEPATVKGALAAFTGVGRRFEVIGEAYGVTVIDDYAHHPTEIRATLESAAASKRRVICLFQPHRYSRTAILFEAFAAAFPNVEHLLLHEIYPAGETPLPGVSGEALAKAIREKSGVKVDFSTDIGCLEKKAAALACPGDYLFTMGAGDITASAPRLVALLKERGS